MKSNIFNLKVYLDNSLSLNAPRLFQSVYFNSKPSYQQVNNYINAWIEVSGTQYDRLIKGDTLHIQIDHTYQWLIQIEELQVIIGLDKSIDLFSYCGILENKNCLCTSIYWRGKNG